MVLVQRDSCTIGSSGLVKDKSIGGPWAYPEEFVRVTHLVNSLWQELGALSSQKTVYTSNRAVCVLPRYLFHFLQQY